MNQRKSGVLVIGGGILTVPLIECAKQMGLATVVADANPEAPGMALSDTPLSVSTRSPSDIVREIRRMTHEISIEGVVTAGADVERTVAGVASSLGLPGPSPEAAFLCNHKIAMRRRLNEAGLPGPRFAEISDPDSAHERARELRYPLIVKPMDNCGSRGVVRIDRAEDLREAVVRALVLSRSGTVLLEQFVAGTTHTVEMIWDGDQLRLCSIIDTHHGFAPDFVELRHVNPSQLAPERQQRMHSMAAEAALALGVFGGVAKVDFLDTPDGPIVMEMTARLSGGFHCQATTPLALGTNNLRAALDVCRGLRPRDIDIEPQRDRVAICQALFPSPGILRAVRGLAEARSLPGIAAVHALADPGDCLPELRSSADRRFFLIAVADTLDECESYLERAIGLIEFDVEPEASLPLVDGVAAAPSA